MTWGRPCLQVDNSAFTKPEAMIQFTDVFNKNDHGEVPFLIRSAPFMDDIDVSNEDVTKFLKGLNPSKA